MVWCKNSKVSLNWPGWERKRKHLSKKRFDTKYLVWKHIKCGYGLDTICKKQARREARKRERKKKNAKPHTKSKVKSTICVRDNDNVAGGTGSYWCSCMRA